MGNCKKNSVGYDIICEECNIVTKYSGKSGRNAYTRGIEHESRFRNLGKNSNTQAENRVEGSEEDKKKNIHCVSMPKNTTRQGKM